MKGKDEVRQWFTVYDPLGKGEVGVDQVCTILEMMNIPPNRVELLSRGVSKFTFEDVLTVYTEAEANQPKIEVNELVDCLSLINARKSGKTGSGYISVSEFQLLNKIVNKREISRKDAELIFGGKLVVEIHTLAHSLLRIC